MFLRYKDIHTFDNSKTMKIIYSMYREVRSSYIEHAASGLSNPTRLEGDGGTIYQGSRPAGVTRRCPKMVTKCLMYKFTISGYVPEYVHCIYSQSISCRRSLSLFSL